MAKRLEWGETPFDKLSRDELLRHAQRMYNTVESMYSALRLSSHGRTDGFWGTEGTGGKAIEKGRQVLEPIHQEWEKEDIYRSFFRYATDLLFAKNEYRIGAGWGVCPKCGTMLGETLDGKTSIGNPCIRCGETLRALSWEDLKSISEDTQP
jgi:hypothetical protein